VLERRVLLDRFLAIIEWIASVVDYELILELMVYIAEAVALSSWVHLEPLLMWCLLLEARAENHLLTARRTPAL